LWERTGKEKAKKEEGRMKKEKEKS